MNKSIKISLLLVALISAGASWATALTGATNNLTGSSTGTSSDTITDTAHLSESVTLKMSKNVVGSYDISGGGGQAGVATGNPNGKGFIYPNGTSATAANVSPKNVGAGTTNINTTATASAALSAMS